MPLLRSLFWSGLDTAGGLLVGLGSILIVGRLIGPAEFGLGALAVGVALLVVSPINSLVHDAIVQKPVVEPIELDSALAASVLAALAACALLALAAGPLATVMDEPRLAGVLRALLPVVLFGAATAPLIAEHRRAMDFRAVGRAQLLSRALGLLAGTVVALAHGGAWAVVAQQLTATGLLASALLVRSRRTLRWRLRWRAIAPLLAFSHKIVWAQVLLHASDRMFLYGVGYVGGVAAAGYWGAATRMVESFAGTINQAAYHVAFAHFSRLQLDRATLGRALAVGRDALMSCATPLAAALAAGSEPLVRLCLGESWLPAAALVPWLVVGSLVGMHLLLPTVALNALGQTGAGLAATAITTGSGLAGLLVAAPLGLPAIAAVRGGAPVTAWIALARRISAELPSGVGRAGRQLLLDGVALASGLALAAAAAEVMAPEAAVAQLALTVLVGGTAALLVVVLGRAGALRDLLEQARGSRLKGRTHAPLAVRRGVAP